MGIAVNLVTYLDHTMNQPSDTLSTIVSNFSGLSFLTCLLGFFIADSFLGRYWTKAVFAVVKALVIRDGNGMGFSRSPPRLMGRVWTKFKRVWMGLGLNFQTRSG